MLNGAKMGFSEVGEGAALGPFEPVEVFIGGYEARCRKCDQSPWVGDSELMCSLLGDSCPSDRDTEYFGADSV